MNARRVVIGVALFAASLLMGCSSGSKETKTDNQAETTQQAQTNEGEQAQNQAGQMAGKQGMMQNCPMKLDGTKVTAENTPDGVAMDFTTSSDVAQLQQSVQSMAQHHNQMMKSGQHNMMGGGPQGMHGQGMHGQMKGSQAQMSPMPMAMAKYEKTDNGARIVYAAKNPDDVQALQQWMGKHVQNVKNGTCPMQYRMGKGQGQMNQGQMNQGQMNQGATPPANDEESTPSSEPAQP